MQQIVIVGKVWPESASSAAGSRTMELIEAFQSTAWNVSFACAAGESEFTCDLEKHGVCKIPIELNSSQFDNCMLELKPDVVVFDRFTTEEQFGWRVAEHCPNALRILDTIDLHALRKTRQEAVQQNRPFIEEDLLSSNIAMREIASIYRCDLTLMVSDFEMKLLRNVFKMDSELIHYTPFLFDAISEKEVQEWPQFEHRNGFVSIGNFLHEPNWDAVLWLKTHIWPLIRKELPKVELHVYGAYTSQKVINLHNLKEGFMVMGRAESAEKVMREARICLAPLRFGAGIKGKLSDAMRYGAPSITTSIGAEGMHNGVPWPGSIANTVEEFAKEAVELYQNKMRWKLAQQNGIQIIKQVFSKHEHTALLIDKIVTLQKNLKQHRLRNFIGNMLQQQTTAATRYMALYIEAKNKNKA